MRPKKQGKARPSATFLLVSQSRKEGEILGKGIGCSPKARLLMVVIADKRLPVLVYRRRKGKGRQFLCRRPMEKSINPTYA